MRECKAEDGCPKWIGKEMRVWCIAMSRSVNDNTMMESARITVHVVDYIRQDLDKHNVDQPWKSSAAIFICPFAACSVVIPPAQAADGSDQTGIADGSAAGASGYRRQDLAPHIKLFREGDGDEKR
jgi:hypothetical protein